MFIRIVYRTPKCPKCESLKTGRFIEYHGFDPDKYQSEHLRNGEYIIPAYTSHTNNLFCTECGFEWMGTGKWTIIKEKEFEKIKEELDITDETIEELEDHGVYASIDAKKKNKFKTLKNISNAINKYVVKRTTDLINDIAPHHETPYDDFDDMLNEIAQEDSKEEKDNADREDSSVDG